VRAVVEQRLITSFSAKGRMQSVLSRIPVDLVLDGQVGLRGAAARVGITNRGQVE
jgi:glucokinase